MNILFVADVSISSVIGGAERVLFEQSSRLAQRGHNVHILTRKLGNQELLGTSPRAQQGGRKISPGGWF